MPSDDSEPEANKLSSERIVELEHKVKKALDTALDQTVALLKDEGVISTSGYANTDAEIPAPEILMPAEDNMSAPQESVPTNGVPTNRVPTNSVPVKNVPLFQVVWTPFRSETSARGFADKLSLQIQQQFEVVKMGPGHYEVGFNFVNPPERIKVLDAINTMTGFISEQPARAQTI